MTIAVVGQWNTHCPFSLYSLFQLHDKGSKWQPPLSKMNSCEHTLYGILVNVLLILGNGPEESLWINCLHQMSATCMHLATIKATLYLSCHSRGIISPKVAEREHDRGTQQPLINSEQPSLQRPKKWAATLKCMQSCCLPIHLQS